MVDRDSEEFIPIPQMQQQQAQTSAITLLIEDFVFPDKFIQKMKKSLMGNCEFRYDPNAKEIVLGEWVKELSDEPNKYNFVWVSPPKSKPLIKNFKLWQAVEHYIRSVLNSATALSRMRNCQINAKMKIWTFGKYMIRNWNEFELDYATFDELFVSLGYLTLSAFTASKEGDIKRWTTSLISVQESRSIIEEKNKTTGLEKVFKEA